MALKKLSQIAASVGNPALTDTLIGVGSGTTDLQYTLTQVKAAISPTAANPTASVGLTAVNGSAATFMRSDGAPALDQTANWNFAPASATSGFRVDTPTFDIDSTNHRVGIGTITPSAKLSVVAGTLGDQLQGLNFTATQPAIPTGFQAAYLITVTSAGSAGQNNNALSIQYNAGYTGSSGTSSMRAINSVAGTGATLIPVAESVNTVGNFGFLGVANGTTTGTNIAGWGAAVGGDVNVALAGVAQTSKSGAGTKVNIGVAGSGYNAVTGGSTPVQVGGWFSLNQTTIPSTSAALIADNGSQTSDIFKARDNGSDVFTIADGGVVTLTQTGGIIFTNPAAATLRLGAAPNATPVANTFQIGESSRAGTDSNVAGASGVIQSGTGTGIGALATLALQSPVAAASGSGAQTQTTGLTIKNGTAVRASYTVATLPTASTVQGAMAFVTDANTTMTLGIGTTVVGSGANKVPVYSDGTNWIIG